MDTPTGSFTSSFTPPGLVDETAVQYLTRSETVAKMDAAARAQMEAMDARVDSGAMVKVRAFDTFLMELSATSRKTEKRGETNTCLDGEFADKFVGAQHDEHQRKGSQRGDAYGADTINENRTHQSYTSQLALALLPEAHRVL